MKKVFGKVYGFHMIINIEEGEIYLNNLSKVRFRILIMPYLILMNSISAEAWEMWKSHQTTLINEKHLDMSEPKNREWLQDQMNKFFNNEDYESAAGFKALE